MNGQPEPPPQHQLSSSWRNREPSLGFILKTSTWLSDSHGLYDYESRNVSAKTYKCYGRHGNYRVLRRGEDVSLVTERLAREILASDSNVQTVVKITTTTQGIPGYSIQAGNCSEDQGIAAEKYNSSNPLVGEGKVGLPAIHVEEHRSKDLTCHTSKDNRDIWVVCRSLREGLLPLKQGTVLRFGRYLTRVKELVRDEVDSERLASCGGLAVSDSEGEEVAIVRPPPTVGRSGNVEIRGSASSPPNELLDLVVGGPQLIGERPEDDEGNTAAVELNSEHCLDRVSYHDAHVNPSLDECHDSRRGEFVIGGINIVSRGTLQRNDQEGDSTDHESIYNSAASSILQITPRRKAADDAYAVLRLPSSLEDTVSVTAKICRVCLCEQECDSNPVISACKCKGSMKGIHLECLRTWMRGRLNIKSTESNTCYYWRPLECELCKEPYPKYVDLIHPNERISKQTALMALKQNPTSCPSDDNRELVELLALPRPKPPYIVLETRQEGLPFSRGYHFVSFSDADKASLGRGHEVDIKIADISVSRIHALLRYQPKREYYANVLRDYPFQRYTKRTHPREVCDLLGEFHDPKTLEKPYFYVEDLRSKFGTLIESPDPIHLFPRMSISIQVGRSVLTFFMARPSWSWFPMRPSGLHLPYRLRFRRKKPASAHVLSSGGEQNPSGSIDWHEVERMDVRIVESFLPLSLYTNNTINSRHNTISNQDGASQQLPSGNVAQ